MLLLRCPELWAQTPIHRRFTTEEGLPSNTVYAAVQDDQGYIWFATDAGVSRFDGKTFVNYGTEDGLPDSDIINLYQDSKRRIWFLGFNGRLGFHLDGKFHNMTNNADLARFRCPSGFQSVVEDAEGMMWFGGIRHDVLRLDPDGDRDRYWEFSPRPLSVGLDEEGRILVTRGRSIMVLRNEEWQVTDSLEPPFQNVFLRPSSGPRNGMVALSSGGIPRIVDHRWEPWVVTDELRNEKHQACWFEAPGTIWIRRWQRGVERWKVRDDGEVTAQRVLFPDETINFVYTDRDRNVWFATPRSGVMLCQPGQEETVVHQGLTGPVKGTYLSLERDRRGVIWAGTAAGQVYALEEGRMSADVGWEIDRGMGRVKGLLEQPGGTMLAAADNGVFRFDPAKRRFFPVRSADARKGMVAAKGIDVDRDGHLWVASFGIHRSVDADPAKGIAVQPTAIGIQRVHHIVCDPTGRVWYSTMSRLHVLEGEVDRHIPVPGLSDDSSISDLCMGPGGTLLVATLDKGIHMLKDGVAIARIHRGSGLVSDRVEHMRCLGDTVLACTSKGLQVFVLEHGKMVSSWSLGASSVLATDQVNDALLVGQRLFAATALGHCEAPFPPPPAAPFIPELHLTSISVNGQRVVHEGDLEVNTGDRVGVVVHPIDYSSQRQLDYQYSLDRSGSWAPAESGNMEFAGMGKGDHRLQMRVRRPDGGWSAPVELAIRVIPPWWDHVAFKVLGLLLLSAATGLLVRNSITRSYRRALDRERQRTALNEERRRISADVHDDLGAELSNVLMHVRNAARTTSDPVAKSSMEKVAGGVAVTIGRIDEIIWSLDPQRDNLRATVHFIEQQASDHLATHGINFRTAVSISEDELHLSANRRRELWLIVREALRNVVKHAKASTVTITWTGDARGSTLTIEDDGDGFPEEPVGTGRSGLKNMQERARKIGATFHAGPGANGGTKVEVVLPPMTSPQRMTVRTR
ncbi:MAG TPA: two-component regulator propeller domain-containing protein [Flavobacteriales bacterium]